jgi:hypothetical protein
MRIPCYPPGHGAPRPNLAYAELRRRTRSTGVAERARVLFNRVSLEVSAMQKNVGNIDKVLRSVVGIALLSQVFAGPLGPVWWGWIGIVPLATVLLGWCPAYALIGVSSRKG